MTLKILKPTTPGQRGTVLVSKSHLWKGDPYKSLVKPQNLQVEEIIKDELLLEEWVVV